MAGRGGRKAHVFSGHSKSRFLRRSSCSRLSRRGSCRPAGSVSNPGGIAMTSGVFSEVGTLRKVLVCKPGLAQSRLTPANCRELLFDDVLWVAQARTDHYAFVTA